MPVNERALLMYGDGVVYGREAPRVILEEKQVSESSIVLGECLL